MLTIYMFPRLAEIYAGLLPWAEMLMRVTIGLCLIPHGLRAGFGFFPKSGAPVLSLRMLSDLVDKLGYRPGKFWAPVVIVTEVIGGPLLAVGLFTRPVSIPIFILLTLSVYEHIKDGWFWNTLGVEYPLMWAVVSLYFLINGGGPISLDHLIGWEF
jgi:putative oxidoreductase